MLFLKKKDIMGEMLLGGDPLHTEYSVRPGAPFRLNLQMVADSLEDMLWEYTPYCPGERTAFAGCQIYHGQRPLLADILYVIPEGMEGIFRRTGSATSPQPRCGARRPICAVSNAHSLSWSMIP